MEIIYAALLGVILDFILGDPRWMPHPVVYMGKGITWLEKLLRNHFPKNEKGELKAGTLLAVFIIAGTLAVSCGVLYLCTLIHPYLRFLAEVIWSWQVLALKDLRVESMDVYNDLASGSLEKARADVSKIVGRETKNLTEEGVTKAAVETVAENFSDGVIAPLLYLFIGGVPLALCYKAVNTMDSMVGYKNDRYLYFGRCAAKLDDIVNYIPARISGLLLIVSSGICGLDIKNAVKVWKRDRKKHSSPNSAQTESVVAGALDVRLAGPAYYFGQYYDKPTLGDPIRPIESGDIPKANRMNLYAALLGFIIFCGLRMAIVFALR